MNFLIISAIFLHTLFLLSIFYIYFKSIIIPGLKPLPDLYGAPAKRVVLFVADGLRAESFYKFGCNRTEFLRDVLLNHGITGVSHTRVPTESRPGHVALIAGVYEDPSALLKGWKENPVEFDSVFNRSYKAFAWGSPDIVPMFVKGAIDDKVFMEVYDASDESFGGDSVPYKLDLWVFDKVKDFFKSEEAVEIKKSEKVFLFLHLLGLDTTGHVFKPNSEMLTTNMKVVDQGIKETVELIDNYFNDKLTAYIFTSDHGMTNRGSHGAGQPHETETPFLAWGAGVNNWKGIADQFLTMKHVKINGLQIPRYDIEQADVAPLMSTLLGTAPPVNNFGKLPFQYLNVSKEYLAKAFANNANQLLVQYRKLHEQSLQRTFKISFNYKEAHIDEDINFFDEQIKLSFTLKDYDDIIVLSNKLVVASQDGIEFYQTYHKHELLVALTLTMLGWLLILYQCIMTTTQINFRVLKRYILVAILLMTIILVYNYLQNTPAIVTGYFLLPVVVWLVVLNNQRKCKVSLYQLLTSVNFFSCSLFYILVAEVFVFGFFNRKVLSVALIFYSIGVTIFAFKVNIGGKMKIAKYFISSLCLGIFPLLPVVEKDTKHSILLIFGTIFWILKSLDYTFLKRYDKLSIVQSTVMFSGGLFFMYLVIAFTNDNGINIYQQTVSWILLCSPILIISGSLNMELRLKAIGNGLSLPYILMSLSYEPLFLLAFFISLYNWVEVEIILCSRRMKQLKDFQFVEPKIERKREIGWDDLRSAAVFMLYLMIAFFGTGNMATISSFDPNWVRCLVTTFSPFLMAFLIIIKLMIPLNMLSCSLRAIHLALKVNAQKHFLLILVICDIMCLNFLFLVKNKGSWLDIGTSLSHFIIMECTVLIVIGLYLLAHILTTFQAKWPMKQLPTGNKVK